MTQATPDEHSFIKVFWGVPTFLAIHNMEEGAFASAFLRSGRAPELFHHLADRRDPAIIFTVALVVLTVVPFVVGVLGDLANPRSRSARFLVLLQTVMFANAFWHVSVALAIRGYAPGVVTATLCEIPFSVYLLGQAWKRKWVRRSIIVVAGCSVMALQAVVFVTVVLPK